MPTCCIATTAKRWVYAGTLATRCGCRKGWLAKELIGSFFDALMQKNEPIVPSDFFLGTHMHGNAKRKTFRAGIPSE